MWLFTKHGFYVAICAAKATIVTVSSWILIGSWCKREFRRR